MQSVLENVVIIAVVVVMLVRNVSIDETSELGSHCSTADEVRQCLNETRKDITGRLGLSTW